jgi:putative ABC transport system permease protein
VVRTVVSHLRYRAARSLLTMAGVAVGIAAVVALAGVARGFETSWVRMYTARGTDLVITKRAVLRPVPAPFPQAQVADLRTLPGVAEAGGVLTDLMGIERAPIVLVLGLESNTFVWKHLRLESGRWPANDAEAAVVLGTVAADVLDKRVGSELQIETGTFLVSGIVESSAMAENGAVVMTLPQLQRVTDQQGKVNFLNLKLTAGTTPDQIESLRRSIVARLPGFKAFTAGEVADNNTAIQAVRAMSWATSVIALIVGAVGVMNAMLMSVFERTREIGILAAVGWRRGRIVLMILCESIALSLAGGAIGIGIGVMAVAMLQTTPLLRGKIEGDFSASLFAMALAISIGVGAIGGLYPAYRGAWMRPGEALRHE